MRTWAQKQDFSASQNLPEVSPLIGYFIPEAARALPETERRIRLQVRSCLALTLIALPVVILNYLVEGGSGPTIITLTIGIPLMLINAFLLRKGLSPSVAGTFITLELVASLTTMSYFNGGIEAASIAWLIPVPLVAQFLIGPRFGLPFAVIVAAVVIAFYAVYERGILLSPSFNRDDEVVWHMVGAITSALFVAGLGWYFDSERKRADALTRRSEERLRLVVANAEVTLVSFDTEGRIILSAGKTHPEMSASIFSFFPPAHESAIRSALEGQSCHFEVAMAERFLEAWLVPTRTSADVVNGATCLMVDITARKRMEQTVALTEKMASLGTLAAGIGHEINNPLGYVLGNTNFVIEELDKPDATSRERMKSALVDARDGLEQIRRIVGELRTFARPESDAQSHALTAVDIQSVIERALALAGNQVRHHAQLVTDYGETPSVRGAEGPLLQVLMNLLVNAAQAIEGGTRHDNEIRITTRFEQNMVVIEVADTGSGIAPEHMSRLFEPFFTTKAATGMGMGLGLSTSHRIVESMNGRIEVHARPSGGTCFRVHLPAAELSAATSVFTPPDALPVQPASILVIDDIPALLKSIKRMLRPHNVTTASSGQEAMMLLEQQDFDLILCDLMMPQMTGIDVFNAVKEKFRGTEARIVFMTGGVFTSTVQNFFATTPKPCLDKPFTPEEVKSFVARCLRAELSPDS